MIAVREPKDALPRNYALAPGSPVRQIQPGEPIRLTVAERLTVFVQGVGEVAPGANGIASMGRDAKVLSIDRSYRLLTLLHRDGRRETFKVPEHVKLGEMQPGDEVAIESVQVIAVRPGK